MNKNKNIHAIIFDMDGVLVHSMSLWKEAVQEVVTSLGSQFTEELWDEVRGRRLDEIIIRWHQVYPWNDDNDTDEVIGRVLKRASQLVQERGTLRDGAHELLDYCKRERQLPLALASSAYFQFIQSVLKAFDLEQYFSVVHSAEYESLGKPHPGVYLSTAEKLDVAPEQCLVFEDSVAGVISAKAAKMYCVAVPETIVPSERFCIANEVHFSLRDWKKKEEDAV